MATAEAGTHPAMDVEQGKPTWIVELRVPVALNFVEPVLQMIQDLLREDLLFISRTRQGAPRMVGISRRQRHPNSPAPVRKSADSQHLIVTEIDGRSLIAFRID